MTKNKHELLVPVGSYESLIAAINNGADAVYLGGKKFGARAFANNFTDEEIEKAIKLCHLYGVKVYITVNTLIHDDEMAEALEYIKYLHRSGVDAVIMQDIGLINLVHQTLPNLEIHASTQMHNHSCESLEFLKELGIKRVVFAREMPIDYLCEMQTDLEKEVFIHGSLCISYSGQCLFSSCILNRSGNRGECAGMCRLPYKLLEDNSYVETQGDYLLSPKDLCSVYDFKKLLDSDIVSFKIEGRMKSPAYVAVVTRIYKNLMNQYANNEPLKVNEEDFKLLKAIFNREYTKGFLFGDNNIMNYDAPNHQGIHLGKVESVTSKKIKIKLDCDLKQFEGIRFKESNKGIVVNFLYDQNDNLVNGAKKGDIIYLDNFINLNSLDEVMLTTPLVELPEVVTKKIKVDVHFEAKLNNKTFLKVIDGENIIEIEGEEVTKARTSPVTSERIVEALGKMGNTPFELNDITTNIDSNIFISIGSLNKIRREALEKLKEVRENKKAKYQENFFDRIVNSDEEYGPVINVLVRNKEQIKACEELGIKNIIVEDSKLMKYNYLYKVPRDKTNHNYPYENLVVTDYASLDKYPMQIADYHLNIYNHYTFDYLQNKAKSLMLSVELNMEDIQKLMSYYPKGAHAEVLVYGRIELMLMKHCPLNKIVNKDKICSVCQKGKKYLLEDRNGAKYPIINNPFTHSTCILHHEITNLISQVKELQNMGVSSFRVEFYDESYEDTKNILRQIISKIIM